MHKRFAVLLSVVASLFLVAPAQAGDGHGGKGKNWGWGDRYDRHPQDDHIKIDIGRGVPYYSGGRQCDRPVYYAPPPAYYYPQPIYYAPARPVYYYNPRGATLTFRSR